MQALFCCAATAAQPPGEHSPRHLIRPFNYVEIALRMSKKNSITEFIFIVKTYIPGRQPVQ